MLNLPGERGQKYVGQSTNRRELVRVGIKIAWKKKKGKEKKKVSKTLFSVISLSIAVATTLTTTKTTATTDCCDYYFPSKPFGYTRP